ncbi:MAG: methylenetetrahydrofolate reductase [Synergistaceae bacterium]|jgi:methylenetetrahydrofolate reductase (NADPH)|nr:methylenetetrahydrofolate reductase [Synergistaceae bacterium]
MRIDDLLKNGQTISFEVFPPKPGMDADLSGIRSTLSALGAADPDFVSITYGSGGNNRSRAIDIADIVISLRMRTLSHLTAVSYTKEEISGVLDALTDSGVENILALRGDIPLNSAPDVIHWKDFRRASELARFVRYRGEFCIGGAAYAEGHQDSVSPEADIEFMREKAECGVSFFITQLFFDNDAFLRLLERSGAAGVNAPILAGIMPVLRARQIRRIIEISGCKVPAKLEGLLDRYLDDDASMMDAGIDYAAEQISSLWSKGVAGVHIYTMNKSAEVLEILRRCNLERGGGR